MYLTLNLIVLGPRPGAAVSAADYRLQYGVGAASAECYCSVSPLTLIRCQAQEEEPYMIITCLIIASSGHISNFSNKE